MNTRIKTIPQLAKAVARDDRLKDELLANPEATLSTLANESVIDTDVVIYRIAVVVLGATILLPLIGGYFLLLWGYTIPEFVVPIVSAAVGGLVGLLGRTSTQN